MEGGNSPVTPEADKVLRQQGILVLPDILVNGGGVVVSFLEWVQNIQSFQWVRGYACTSWILDPMGACMPTPCVLRCLP